MFPGCRDRLRLDVVRKDKKMSSSFSWFKEIFFGKTQSETKVKDVTKNARQSPGIVDWTDSFSSNIALTRGLYHNTYPGFKLAGGLAFTPIAVPVWFMGLPIPEPADEKSEAHKAGYMNICEIGKERIRRAGEKIKEEKGLEAQSLDIGFKVLKLDTSNIRKWQPDYDNLEQSLLDYVDNYMEGRTELDVVYEIMLKYGLDLTYPVDEFILAQKKVYSIGFGMLMICLDDEITTEVAKGILEKVKELAPESTRVVFKDNGFKTDSNKTNIKEILKSGGIEEFITL